MYITEILNYNYYKKKYSGDMSNSGNDRVVPADFFLVGRKRTSSTSGPATAAECSTFQGLGEPPPVDPSPATLAMDRVVAMVIIDGRGYQLHGNRLISYFEAQKIYEALVSSNSDSSEADGKLRGPLDPSEPFCGWGTQELCYLQWLVFVYCDQHALNHTSLVLIAKTRT